MHKLAKKLIVGFIFLGGFWRCWGADMAVQLQTTDGTTKFSIQNSAAAEVSSVDSLGNATFTKVTQTGTGGSFILNQNVPQAAATFDVSSGTATNFNTTTLKFTDGTTQTTASLGGTISGVTAGVGLTGGGVTGNVQLNLAPNSTNYIRNTTALQSGATFYISSGTVSGPLTVGGTETVAGVLVAGTGVNQITTAAGLLDATKLTGNLPALNGSALTNLTGTNVVGNIPGNAVSVTGAISNTSIDSSSVTKQGNTFNAANQLVQLDASGNIPLPSGAHITVGALQGTILPSGTLILTTGTCPSGFAPYNAAGGYYLVGVPSGGSVGQTVGTAMTDLSNATHNHTVTSAAANDGSTLVGNTSVVTSVTTPTSDVARGFIAPYFQIRLCSVP